MNPHKQRILRALSTGPKSIRLFTEGSDQLRIVPRLIEVYAEEMQSKGWIDIDGLDLQITKAGRDALLAESLKHPSTASARIHCNANMPVWTPKEWKTVRTGADDHLNYSSRGIGA